MTLKLYCDRCEAQAPPGFDGRLRIKHTHAEGGESKRRDTVVDVCPSCASELEALIDAYLEGGKTHA